MGTLYREDDFIPDASYKLFLFPPFLKSLVQARGRKVSVVHYRCYMGLRSCHPIIFTFCTHAYNVFNLNIVLYCKVVLAISQIVVLIISKSLNTFPESFLIQYSKCLKSV